MATTKRGAEIERLLERGKREGLTYAELAETAGLKRSTLSAWAWRLRRERRTAAPAPVDDRPRFVELITERREAADGEVAIELRSGRRIVAAVDVDPARLLDLVRALEQC
jgi:transposase-like protein